MSDDPPTQPAHAFRTTHWSMILTLREGSDEERRAALETLARQYWYPLYFFIRRKGRSHEDAQDLAQGFFETMLARDSFEVADAARGRFRTFLLTCLDHYLKNEWRNARAQRRGGGCTVISLDDDDVRNRYENEPESPDLPADKAFDRKWAETVIASVLARMERDFSEAGKGEQFEAFKPFLVDEKGAVSYEAVAERLGMGVSATRTAIHRFRQRYARCFREVISDTVESPDDVEAEMRDLFAALGE